MSATVVEFPYGRASSRHRALPPCTRSEVLRFPARAQLTEHDLGVLVGLSCAAPGDWVCEAERDNDGNLAVAIVTGRPQDGDYAAFVVCPSNRKLLLIEAQPPSDWRLIGAYNEIAEIADVLSRAMAA